MILWTVFKQELIFHIWPIIFYNTHFLWLFSTQLWFLWYWSLAPKWRKNRITLWWLYSHARNTYIIYLISWNDVLELRSKSTSNFFRNGFTVDQLLLNECIRDIIKISASHGDNSNQQLLYLYILQPDLKFVPKYLSHVLFSTFIFPCFVKDQNWQFFLKVTESSWCKFFLQKHRQQ